MKEQIATKEQISFTLNGKLVVPEQENQSKLEEQQKVKPDEQDTKIE